MNYYLKTKSLAAEFFVMGPYVSLFVPFK